MTFKCKEPKCDKEVEFVYEPEDGVLEWKSASKLSRKPKGELRARLTCEDGHTHTYMVKL